MVLGWVAWVTVFCLGFKSGGVVWVGEGGLLNTPASKTTFRKQHLKDRGGLAEHLQSASVLCRTAERVDAEGYA